MLPILITCTIAIAAQESSRPMACDGKVAERKNGYATMRVHFGDPSFVLKPAPIKIVVENTGSHPLEYVDGFVERTFEFEVLDGKGKQVPRTRYGNSLPKNSTFASGNLRTLKSGQRLEIVYDLQVAFEMTVPDDYKVNIVNSNGFTARIGSMRLEKCAFEFKNIAISVLFAPPEK